MDIFQRRKALADALSAHEPFSIKSFLHPSFVVRGSDGVITLDYAHLLDELPAFFKNHPEYRQSVEILSSKIEGDTALLATRRNEVLRVLWWSHTISSDWNEVWKKSGDDWLLAEEKPKTP